MASFERPYESGKQIISIPVFSFFDSFDYFSWKPLNRLNYNGFFAKQTRLTHKITIHIEFIILLPNSTPTSPPPRV